MAGKVPLEDGAFLRDQSLALNGLKTGIDCDDPVHHLENFRAHTLRPTSGGLCSDQFVDPGAEVLEHEILLGGGLAVVHFLGPLLQRQLDPESLVDGEGDVQKSRLSMPRSSMAWLSGVMVSRGMSQVSAMMLATVSNVEDISTPL